MTGDAERLAAAFEGAGPLERLDAPPQDVAAGYDLQDAVRAKLGRPIVGWKLAQTTPEAQAPLGIDAPTVAPILEGMIVPAETVFGAGRFYKPEVEAEIALELATPIEAELSRAEAAETVAGMRVAIEVADTRYTDKKAMGVAAVIADMNSCGALVVGPLEPIERLAWAATGEVFARIGDGSRVDGLKASMRPDPVAVLAFLSGFVTRRGHTIPAGAIITTGTHTAPTLSGPGAIGANFSPGGRVTARLSEPSA